jgi:hypothetical protein
METFSFLHRKTQRHLFLVTIRKLKCSGEGKASSALPVTTRCTIPTNVLCIDAWVLTRDAAAFAH